MQMNTGTVGLAIEGCTSEWEELALAFCKGAEPEARELSEYLQVRERYEMAKQEALALQAEFEESKRVLAGATADWEACRKFPIGDPMVAAGFVLAGIGFLGAVASSLVEDRLAGIIWPLAVLLMVVGVAWFGWQAIGYFRRRSAAQAEVSRCELAVGAAEQALSAHMRHIVEYKQRIQSFAPKRSVRCVGKVVFSAEAVELNDAAVAIDRSGVVKPSKFTIADFSFNSAELQSLLARIDELRTPPVFLCVDDDQPGEGGIDELHGEERELRRIVEDFAGFVGRIPTTEVALPLFNRDSAVVREFSSAVPGKSNLPRVSIHDAKDAERSQSLAKLVDAIGSSKARGIGPKVEVTKAHNLIADLLSTYQKLRSTSMQSIHSTLMSAMERASWCQVHFYCPKTTRNPVWITRQYGIDINSAHEEPNQAALVDRLLQDEKIAERCAEDPELVVALERAYQSYMEMLAQGRHSALVIEAAEASVGGVPRAQPAARPADRRAYDSQSEQHLEDYRRCLTKIIFGQVDPEMDISEQSRLSYDPVSRVWSNEIAGTEYVDGEELDCARVVRVNEEVLFPIWRHLWTEKADFRKAELFRSNEQILRMNEKESEKLIAIGNQFRDDMRSTREVVKTVASDLQGKLEQITQTRDALSRHGLISGEGGGVLSDSSLHDLSGGSEHIVRSAEAREIVLALEPQSQAERRRTVIDPISLVFHPNFALAIPDKRSRVRSVAKRVTSELESGDPIGALASPGGGVEQ
jgi:hypothetical protein